MNASLYSAPQELQRYRQRALLVGVLGLALCGVGAFSDLQQFFRSYLLGYLYWAGIALGCLAIVMLQHLSGGRWGIVTRRFLESGTRTIPLLAVLFVPLAFGVTRLYEWADPHHVAGDPILQQKQLYLNVPFFLGRAVLYFVAWAALAYFLNKWSSEQDRTADPTFSRRLEALSGPGLVVFGATITFSSVDWVMSLEPHWFSTVYGLFFMTGQTLAALAFVTATLILLASRKPLSDVIGAGHLHDLGKLLLAFVMIWAYLAFSQFLIIYAGNLPEETPWYLRRLQGGWKWVALVLVLFHFALPFLLLLSRSLKRDARRLWLIALLVVVMRFVDLFWVVTPALHHEGGFHLYWMDLAAPVGIGGLWLAFYLRNLSKMPLLPVHDPHLEEALEDAEL
ncbi:MAG: hypothetical protein AB1898_25425 [Acidobacteriota bacterium]